MSKQEKKPLFREHLKKEIIGVFWLAVGIYLMLCLLTFNSGDPSFNNNLHPDKISNFGGIIGSHYPEMDMISFGPTIRNPHSPDEMVNAKTVGLFWDFLVETLKHIPGK